MILAISFSVIFQSFLELPALKNFASLRLGVRFVFSRKDAKAQRNPKMDQSFDCTLRAKLDEQTQMPIVDYYVRSKAIRRKLCVFAPWREIRVFTQRREGAKKSENGSVV